MGCCGASENVPPGPAHDCPPQTHKANRTHAQVLQASSLSLWPPSAFASAPHGIVHSARCHLVGGLSCQQLPALAASQAQQMAPMSELKDGVPAPGRFGGSHPHSRRWAPAPVVPQLQRSKKIPSTPMPQRHNTSSTENAVVEKKTLGPSAR